MNRSIDMMIVGAQKAGTTSLKNYLGQHPSLVTHELTEFAFFVGDDEYRKGFDAAVKTYFPGEKLQDGKKIIAKNAGIYCNEEALYRLQQHNPECILVLVIRNPVDRAYSSYNMERESGWFVKPWSDISSSLENFRKGTKDQMFRLFIELGMYSEQLKKIYKFFPESQVEVIVFDELKTNPAVVCSRLFKRIAVDDSFVPDTSSIYNPTKKVRSKKVGKFLIWLMNNENPLKKISKKMLPQSVFSKLRELLFNANTSQVLAAPKPMSASVREELVDFFKPYNKELEAMTGKNLKHWNK